MPEAEKPGIPLLDRALLAIAPGIANKRMVAQRSYFANSAALGHLRKYEAAKSGRRTEGWNRPGTSANVETTTSFSGLSAGARQMVRDNGHAANAINVLANNTIGTGIRPGFQTDSDQGDRRLMELWEEHAEGSGSGAGEMGGVYERQLVGFRSIVEGGSVLYRRRRRTNRDMTLPYVVQVLEPDYLATFKDGIAESGGRILAGKEFSRRDELIAAHLYLQHPGDALVGVRGFGATTRVLASEFSHAYRTDRAGQVQGASWFAPIITDLRDLADTRDSYQLRQKIAACYTVFITENEPGAGTPHQGKPTTDHIEPGRVESIPPGKEVTFANPPGVEGMSDFDRAQLMTIAAGLGIPYEALTGDLSRVNFLSGRMGWLAFYRNIDSWRTNILIPKVCNREMNWFMEAAAVSLGLREPVRVTWTSPHRDLLDPGKEIKALREEMRLGALSYPDMVRMRGRNPDQVLKEWATWARKVDDEEMVYDWDPRKYAATGNNIQEQMTEAIEEASDA